MLPNGICRVLKENRQKDLLGCLGSYSLDNAYIEFFFEESLFRMFYILQETCCRELVIFYFVTVTLQTPVALLSFIPFSGLFEVSSHLCVLG